MACLGLGEETRAVSRETTFPTLVIANSMAFAPHNDTDIADLADSGDDENIAALTIRLEPCRPMQCETCTSTLGPLTGLAIWFADVQHPRPTE